jgi:C_GCAxxG_C_C family probable redox protein
MEGPLSAENAKLIEQAYRRGYELEQRYYGCAQCVVAAIQDIYPIHDSVFRAATSLCGGIASSIEGPCGAFTGGVLVLSSFFGRSREDYADITQLRRPVPLVRVYWDRFKSVYGGDTCRQIQMHLFGQAYRFLDWNEYQAYEEAGGHDDKCPDVVGRACAWLVELLLEHKVPRRIR